MSDTERRAPSKLARFFAEMWEFHQGGTGIDGNELEDALLRSGLARVCPATAEDAARFDEVEPGDEVVTLTDEGRAIIDAGRTP